MSDLTHFQRFAGKTAIVTGGGSGIGAATVRLLVNEGAKVVLADLSKTGARAICAQLPERSVHVVGCDVGVEGQVRGLVGEAIERFGRVDILVNNAATGVGGEAPDIETDAWLRVMNVTLHSVFWACAAAIPHMRQHGGGVIVNVASISGLGADYGLSSYNTAKAGVVALTRALALDHAKDNIRVNALCPGLIDTPAVLPIKSAPALWHAYLSSIPMNRTGTPEEMAQSVAFLASDQASYMTGATLVVDGGRTAGTGQPNAPRILAELSRA